MEPNLSGIEWLYAISAALGAVFLLTRIVLLVLGAGHDTGGDMDIGHDAAIDGVDGTSDVAFKLISLQSLMAFFLMFGLVGLALYRQSQVGVGLSLAGALAAGIAAVYVIGWLFKKMLSLQSSGTLSLDNAVGQIGKVYLRIPADGEGQVEIEVQGRMMILSAISVQKEELPTGAVVRVESMVGSSTLGVVKA